MTGISLLDADEDVPVVLRRPEGGSDVLLVCEHASRRLPASLGTLGLDEAALASHIAWDIGGLAVAETMSDALDATLVRQAYSRLAYDCNRPPDSPAAVPASSEIYQVPGNAGLTAQQLRARADTFYHPFQDTISRMVGQRIAAGRQVMIVTVHTFTPVYFGKVRDVAIGILHDTDSRLADALLAAMAGDTGEFRIARNEPYGPQDGVTHTLRRQALPLKLPNVMIEVRNDLVVTHAGQARIGALLADRLAAAATTLEPGAGPVADAAAGSARTETGGLS